MKQKHLHSIAGVIVTLAAVLACVLPGLAVQPAPVTGVNVETAIAGTAQSAAQQTETAQGIVPTPSTVPTPMPTSTPRVSIHGTALILHEDQSATFIDDQAGIQLPIPAGWMPIRVNEDEYYKAFALDVVLQNPAINDHLTALQSVNLDFHRLNAIDIRPDHTPGGIVTNFNVMFEAGDTRSLEKWEQAERSRKSPLDGYRFLKSSYPTLANGTRVLMIEENWNAKGNAGTVYYRGVFFVLPTGTVVLDFYTNNNFKDTLSIDFDQIANGLAELHP